MSPALYCIYHVVDISIDINITTKRDTNDMKALIVMVDLTREHVLVQGFQEQVIKFLGL